MYLRIGNAKLYDSLIARGMYPNKSLTIRMPEIPKKFLRDFVRGNFDGDGCVYLYRSRGVKGKLILRKLSVIFTSGSRDYLVDLLTLLRRNLVLEQNKVYKSSRSFQLRFGTKDSTELFKFMYEDVPAGVFLKRKYDVFVRYLKLRPQRIDKKVYCILQCTGIGLVAKWLTRRSAKPLYVGSIPT